MPWRASSFVKILRVYETDIVSGEQQAQPMGSYLPLEPDELIASARHVVKAEHVGGERCLP